ncbi:MAG: sigma-70 family polymerase sigma factor [Solirubrobacterales bacterium]|nr:sigma-70 family polymerase sigma factor [Solirubrobacterales bacterium]
MSADQPLGALMRRARRTPLLSASDEVRLARSIERGDLRAREKMIESNLRLVFALAAHHRGRHVPMADLVQEGTVGLVRAVERFDHRRGMKFSTYAVWWIRRSLLDAVRDAQLIRVPATAERQLAAVHRAQGALDRAGGRPAAAVIAERTGLSERTVQSLRASARVTSSLDEPVGDDAAPLGDFVADHRAADPYERAIARERQREVSSMLHLLSARHRGVLLRRFGLRGAREQNHHEIGEWLGVGEERSRQLEREALHRLRSIATARAA